MPPTLPPPLPPTLPAAPGLYRLRTAGIASPTPPGPMADALPASPLMGPTDLLVELGTCTGSPGDGFDLPSPRDIRILASGTPSEIDAHPAAQTATATSKTGSESRATAIPIDITHAVLMPGMVNAHTHLDLTHLGPLEHDPDAGFVAWVNRVREGRAQTSSEIKASVRRGIDLSLRGGVVLVGDIAGAASGVPRLEPFEALAGSPLSGVSFVEFFAIGTREAAALERLEGVLDGAAGAGILDASRSPASPPQSGTRLGLQPHAPNTVSLPAYRRAVGLARRFGLPLATHLAETIEEREFIAHGTGPQREMLERLGAWDDAILDDIGRGNTPIAHLGPVLDEAARDATPFVVAHVNDIGSDGESETSRALEILKRSGVSVAYCPRASSYFGAPAPTRFGPHRYREMLAAGVNVCLGTDSIINLWHRLPAGVPPHPHPHPDGPALSVLDEARLLFARDGTDADPTLADTLLAMMTINGCRALGWDESACSLAPGAQPLGLVAVDVRDVPPGRSHAERVPAERVLRSRAHARLLAIGTGCPGSP